MPFTRPTSRRDSNAEDDPEHREQRAKLVRADLLEADGDGVEPMIHGESARFLAPAGRTSALAAPGRRALASTFVAILPSRISIRRGVTAAISGSCVTSAMVRPSLAQLVEKIAGSSRRCASRGCRSVRRRRRSSGLFTSARAMAARCCWPPESCIGRCLARLSISTSCSASIARSRRSRAPTAGVDHRQLDVLQHAELRQQIEELKHEPDLPIPDARQLAHRGGGDLGAVELDAAFARRIEAAEDVHERGFAAARRADDGDEFAAVDVEVDVVERADFLAAEVVDLADVAEFDEGHPGGSIWKASAP